MKVSLIELYFYNWMYVSTTQNNYFDYLPFDGDQSLITRQRIYDVNYDIV